MSEPEKIRKYFDKAREYAEQSKREPANAATHLEEAKKYVKWANKYVETDAEKAEAAQIEQLIQQAESGGAKPAEEAAGPNPEKTKKYIGKARESLALVASDPAKAQENLEEARKYLKWANKYTDDSLKAEVAQAQSEFDKAAGGGAPAAPAAEAKPAEAAIPAEAPKPAEPVVPATPAVPAAPTAEAPKPAEAAKPGEEVAGPNPEKARKYLGKARDAIAAAEKEPAKASENLEEARKYLKWADKYLDDSLKAEAAQVQEVLDKAAAPKPTEIKPAEAKPADGKPAAPKSERVQQWSKFLSKPAAPAASGEAAKAPAKGAKPLQEQAGKALGEAATKVSDALKSPEAQKAMEDAKKAAEDARKAVSGALGSLFGKKKG